MQTETKLTYSQRLVINKEAKRVRRENKPAWLARKAMKEAEAKERLESWLIGDGYGTMLFSEE